LFARFLTIYDPYIFKFANNWGRVPTSKGEGRERNGKMEGRGWQGGREEGEGGKGRTPVPDYESAKAATLKCGGPPTMPEENRGP